MREKLIEAVGSFKFQIESCGCTIGEYIVPYSIQEPLADHLIANGVVISNSETTTKWIPVTERLPQEDGRYMCNVKSFAFPGSFYQAILKYDKYGFRDGHIYTDDVTHWMPLPEPPKGE